jgi:hypothetical protein
MTEYDKYYWAPKYYFLVYDTAINNTLLLLYDTVINNLFMNSLSVPS